MLEKFREFVEQIREQFRLARLRRARQDAEMEQLRDRHRRRHPDGDDSDSQRSECWGRS
ncbi:hypothetical protein [Halomicronema sp. CCY15110]|uniref:hypothetical protein n=1 Tax=Halomicronema sp. CCY15110 TaxID=2767773 RepID=UPI001951EC00|nr:hypothetical protein [Halomicronema sp. CCY15110]